MTATAEPEPTHGLTVSVAVARSGKQLTPTVAVTV
jgi:hypothetical protein